MIITIDGYSSTGKSTLAQTLAKKLGYNYIDSGEMYRAVTLLALRERLFDTNPWDQKKLIDLLPNINLSFHTNKNTGAKHILLNGENIETQIRIIAVSEKVSLTSGIPEVRKKLLHLQQTMGKDKDLVMDGRDIGSVVFPDAELKIFLTASLDIRADRRYKELIEKGQKTTYEKVLNNLVERDYIDTSRANAPLIKPSDAIEIDNTHLYAEVQLDYVYRLALEKNPSILK
ncbi:MAG: (d)CMP kinase [Flavobacteriales bacterium Tduv]